MIPKSLAIWFVGILATVLAAVAIADDARRLDRRLSELQDEQKVVRQQIVKLRASYAYLTAPDKLRPLAERFLRLEPITGGHLVAFEDVPIRPAPPRASIGDLPPFAQSPFAQRPFAQQPLGQRPAQPPAGGIGPSFESGEPRIGPRTDSPAAHPTPPWLLSRTGPDLQPATFGFAER